MVGLPFERAMVVSYRPSIVTTALSLTIRPQFAVECLRRSNEEAWVTLATWGQNLGRKGSTDVSQILTRSGSDMSYAKNVSITLRNFCRLSTMHERNRQTDDRLQDHSCCGDGMHLSPYLNPFLALATLCC